MYIYIYIYIYVCVYMCISLVQSVAPCTGGGPVGRAMIEVLTTCIGLVALTFS